MRIGMPWWIGAGEPSDGLRLAADAGFDLLEISLDAPWPEGLSAPELAAQAREAGLALGLHAPWRTQSLSHPRGVLARAAGNVAQQCVDFAIGVGAEYVVFHVEARGFARFPRRDVIERGLGHARTALKELAARAGRDLTLLVENTSPPLATPRGVASFLEPLPDIGFCYDPGHAMLAVEAGASDDGPEGEGGATGDVDAWLEVLGRRLALLHLMDVARTETGLVDHLVPGAGELDLGALVGAAEGAGCRRVLIEAFYKDTRRTPAEHRDLAEALERVRAL